ncbi:uncharacterized protein L969DRAFT_93620 [Mixia osmundae IAM 14324]|uniref:SigF-like NTF2-like domain-containing protein n=1 Tax=Mixia osmundae (strain CBS 9802 / IAM 14324 / JCM 22182 / KY 12970) TaxID=764103 RepID=G7DUH9_MIXOS|nr:uncharacterized protein L969DRAFT_93620 [Mixia osmundae IAM 14324]KEI41111.1 hypothetical protein L969DRAFT_93620 [Mixia osmundae IAM 14324]GAA94239.1 hypothetical protein E5Q_00888 [Mixia osmundae IAM 14324]
MENPRNDIYDVVRSLVEPASPVVIAQNIDRYYTEDAYIDHPMLNQPHTPSSREGLKGIYTMLKVLTYGNKMEFHGDACFNEDMTKGWLEASEHLYLTFLPFIKTAPRFLIRIDLVKGKDGLYRVRRQEDNLATDFMRSGVYIIGVTEALDLYKKAMGWASATTGKLVLAGARRIGL